MASSLKTRLARLKENAPGGGKPSTARAKPGSRGAALPVFLETWTRLGDEVFTRRLVYENPLPAEIDLGPFVARLGRPAITAAKPPASERIQDAGKLRLFDLETTGLSGGAGTVAFLAAVGKVGENPHSLVVDQFFLRDYPGEGAFVDALNAALGDAPGLVTYNGKAFDLPLHRTRCVMNGRKPPLPLFHLDLVYTARRLWRDSCGGGALGQIEEGLLGRGRVDDVSGAMIPEIWFDFLARGDHELMERVVSHNAQDVATLATLLARAGAVFALPLDAAARGQADLFTLARILIAEGRRPEGAALLAEAAKKGRREAALYLARLGRREGRVEEARTWLGLAGSGFESEMESSRLAERQEGDLEAALEAARRAEESAGSARQAELARARRRRLELRIAAGGRGRPGRRRS